MKDFSKTEPPVLPVNPPTRTLLPSTSTNTYDLTKILSKKKIKSSITIPKLHSEIKTLKTELQTLKQAQQKDCHFTKPSVQNREPAGREQLRRHPQRDRWRHGRTR